jgi:hypothetical protein
MRIEDIEVKGIASIVKADDMQKYAEGVNQFLHDYRKELGDDWVNRTASQLYFMSKNGDGEIIGSNTQVGAAISTITNIPLITGKQALGLYDKIREEFGERVFNVDVGIYFHGEPITNSPEAIFLRNQLSRKGINRTDGVIDLRNLRLTVNSSGDLIYGLPEYFSEEQIAPISMFPVIGAKKDGLFRLTLSNHFWDLSENLVRWDNYGHLIRYDTKDVEPKPKKDLVDRLTQEFLARLNQPA